MVDKLCPGCEKGATRCPRSCGCQFIQACLFTAARRRAQYQQGPDVDIERWLVPSRLLRGSGYPTLLRDELCLL
jgi:hypothetical protein